MAIKAGTRINVVKGNHPKPVDAYGSQSTIKLTDINDNGDMLFWSQFNNLISYYPEIRNALISEMKQKLCKRLIIMKKVGLCVCQETKNYGSQLQVLATEVAVQKLGYEYEIIRYKKKYDLKFVIKSITQLFDKLLMKIKIYS